MKTLYRAYRPQNFEEIVNQNHIKITLEHEIASNRITHAYLFCGPRGVGKTTIARIFAKSLNCENRKKDEYEPCNKCAMCQELIDGRSLDVIEIDAASHTGVDNVRENIISVARVAPTRCKYKIFIIDEVHMLSISAFNALLKLMEEPPAHTVFILCTTEVYRIPATIISRTERFDFKRISAKDIVKKLKYIIGKEKIKINDNILEDIARQADGHMRDAESLLGQVIAIGGQEVSAEEADLVIPRSDINEVINFLEFLAKKDAGNAIGLINRLLDEGISLKRFLKETIEILRKLLLSKISHGLSEKIGLELGEQIELRITELGKNFQIDYLIKLIDRFLIVQTESKNSFIEQLPWEIAIAELSLIVDNSSISKVNTAKQNKSSSHQSSPSIQNSPIIYSSNISSSKSANTNITSLSVDNIFAKWNEVLTKIKSHNHSLSFILKACQPKDLQGNQLCLAFKYKFHKDRVSESGIKQIIEKVLREVYEQNITIEAIVDENMKVVTKNMDDKKDNQNKTTLIPASKSSKKINKTNLTKNNTHQDEDILNDVLKTFGGKVID